MASPLKWRHRLSGKTYTQVQFLCPALMSVGHEYVNQEALSDHSVAKEDALMGVQG